MRRELVNGTDAGFALIVGMALHKKSLVIEFLCATSVFSVSLWLINLQQTLTTEAQRTRRLHREERSREFLCKASRNQLCTAPEAAESNCAGPRREI
jgi:hypothetical protein